MQQQSGLRSVITLFLKTHEKPRKNSYENHAKTMINLLPPIGKKRVQREYLVRTAGVWALLLSAVLGVFVLLLIPTYVLLSRQLDALSLEIFRLEDAQEITIYQDSREQVEESNALAAQLATDLHRKSVSDIVAQIEAAQTKNISLSGIVYTEEGGSRVEVSGTAATRESLVLFVETLKRSPSFLEATVPVGDLAPDRALPFTLTLIPAPADIHI